MHANSCQLQLYNAKKAMEQEEEQVELSDVMASETKVSHVCKMIERLYDIPLFSTHQHA